MLLNFETHKNAIIQNELRTDLRTHSVPLFCKTPPLLSAPNSSIDCRETAPSGR